MVALVVVRIAAGGRSYGALWWGIAAGGGSFGALWCGIAAGGGSYGALWCGIAAGGRSYGALWCGSRSEAAPTGRRHGRSDLWSRLAWYRIAAGGRS